MSPTKKLKSKSKTSQFFIGKYNKNIFAGFEQLSSSISCWVMVFSENDQDYLLQDLIFTKICFFLP